MRDTPPVQPRSSRVACHLCGDCEDHNQVPADSVQRSGERWLTGRRSSAGTPQHGGSSVSMSTASPRQPQRPSRPARRRPLRSDRTVSRTHAACYLHLALRPDPTTCQHPAVVLRRLRSRHAALAKGTFRDPARATPVTVCPSAPTRCPVPSGLTCWLARRLVFPHRWCESPVGFCWR